MVPTTPSRIAYTGDGVSTSFAFPYYFQEQADLKVFTYVLATGVLVPLVLNVDYSIVGAVTPGFGYESGAALSIPGATTNVPAVIPNTTKVVIFRDPSEIQDLNLPVNSSYPPPSIESELDALTLMMQRLYDVMTARTAKLPDGFADTFDPTLPKEIALVANKGATLVVDPAGGFFSMGPSIAAIGNAAADAAAAAASATAAAASEVAAAADAAAAAADAAAAAASAAMAVGSIVPIDVSAGDVPYNLPGAAANPGKILASPNHIAVSTTGGDTIMGAATDTVEAGESKRYWSDGISQWYLIS